MKYGFWLSLPSFSWSSISCLLSVLLKQFSLNSMHCTKPCVLVAYTGCATLLQWIQLHVVICRVSMCKRCWMTSVNWRSSRKVTSDESSFWKTVLRRTRTLLRALMTTLTIRWNRPDVCCYLVCTVIHICYLSHWFSCHDVSSLTVCMLRTLLAASSIAMESFAWFPM